ncbi:MAG: substrate-binding domain-containing protein [Lachnospiraceae bacterium]|nr:substrate-binding domain-containing protein [Lachnospiraceae bacterium]
MKMKKLLSVILTLSMAGSLVACGAAEKTVSKDANVETITEETTNKETTADTSESKNIMFASIVTGGVAWGSAQKGFEDALTELGWEGQYCSPTTANDTAGVIELLDTAVTNKVDGIVTVILDAQQATDVLTRAHDAKIPVITCNTYTSEDLQNSWIGTDPHNMGVTQAETVLKYFESEKKYDNITACYIQTTLETETQNEQFKAFSDTILAKYPDATLIQDECNSDAATASDKLAALIKSYPDLNVVVSQDGYGCPGIANYVSSEGLQDKLVVIGIDDSPEILNYVTEGALDCTIAQDFYKMGYESVHYIKDIMDGKAPKFANDSGTIIIGPDEVEEHLELLKSRGLS